VKRGADLADGDQTDIFQNFLIFVIAIRPNQRGMHRCLNLFFLKECVHVLGLNPDLTDVIIPVSEINFTLIK